METKFTWDPEKAARNLRKHGVSFETAVEAFSDPSQIGAQNYFVEGEQRLQIIGMTNKLILLLVVFVDRSDEDFEIIHIISARKTVAYEQSAYEDQFR